MRTLIVLLLMAPFVCFSQTRQDPQAVKPPTDACPTWNKKGKSNSKAEYFQFLRSNKAKDTNREIAYRTTQGESSYSITKTTNVEPRTRRTANSSTSINTSLKEENKIKNSSSETIAQEVREESNIPVIKEEIVNSKEVVVAEEETIQSKETILENKELHKTKSEKEAPSVNTEKIKKETKVASRKVKRFFSRKKGAKGKAAKCPDF